MTPLETSTFVYNITMIIMSFIGLCYTIWSTHALSRWTKTHDEYLSKLEDRLNSMSDRVATLEKHYERQSTQARADNDSVGKQIGKLGNDLTTLGKELREQLAGLNHLPNAFDTLTERLEGMETRVQAAAGQR